MTDHLQTILNCVAESITLPQDVSESVSVVINQGSLRHDSDMTIQISGKRLPLIFLYDMSFST